MEKKVFLKRLPITVKLALFALFLFGFYSLFGFLIFPKIIKFVLEDKVSPVIKRSIKIQDVSFNPYKLDLVIKGIHIKKKELNKKGDFFSLTKAQINFQIASVYKLALIISELKLIGPKIDIIRKKDGSFNFSDLFPKEKQDEKKEKEQNNFKFSINNIEIEDGSILFKDQLTGSTHKIEKLSIGIPFISNTKQNVKIYVKPHFYALINGSPFEFKGKTRPFAKDMDTEIHIDLKKVSLPKYFCYVPKFYGLNLSSAFLDSDVYVHFLIKDKSPKVIINGSIIISDVRINKKQTKLITLQEIKAKIKPSNILKGIDFDLGLNKLALINHLNKAKILSLSKLILSNIKIDFIKKELILSDIKLINPDLKFSIDKNGENNLSKFISYLQGEQKDKASKHERDYKKKKDEKQSRFSIFLKSLEINSGFLHFVDNSPVKKVAFDVKDFSCGVKNFILDKDTPFKFDLNAKIGVKGKIAVTGEAPSSFNTIVATIKTEDVFLPTFQGYMAGILNLDFAKGILNSKLRIEYQKEENNLGVTGDFSVDNVLMFDKFASGPFVKWKKVEAKGLSFKMNPMVLSINRVNIVRLHEEMVRYKDGSLNVARVFKVSSSEEKKPSKKNKKLNKADNKKDNNLKLNIKEVIFSLCSIRVVDKSVTPTFVREFNKISGKITGLSNSSDMRASVDISALVDNRSKLKIAGELNPLAKPIYVNVKIDIEGAGVTRFSPYAEKFLGYKIDKGKLFLHLSVKIENDQLNVDNRFILDQFELGKEVESKDAINAPIKLAIALLKDRSGKIDLDIPVSGRLDDPEFSYRSAVLTALINIFIKAATSPFSLLASVVGASESLDKIEFDYGKADLNQKAIEKLDALSKALQDRPSLKVDITGFYDPVKDKEALLKIYFMRKLKKEKFDDLSEQERRKINSLDEVIIDKEEYEKYLEAAYKHATFKRPRNFIGLLKSQPPEKMEQMLKEHIKIDEGDLKNLAFERAKRVANYLINNGKIDPNRIFMVAPRDKAEIQEVSAPIVRLRLK